MEDEELINLMVKIVNRGQATLYRFIENAGNYSPPDRGIEGWFQAELIAELWEKLEGKFIKHPHDGPDLKLPNGEEIELRMTTSFNPGYTVDGIKRGKNGATVLFFSGYLDYNKSDKKKKEKDMEKKGLKGKDFFEQEDVVEEWFKSQFLIKNKYNEISEKSGLSWFSIKYKIVDLIKYKGIVGIIKPSKEVSCETI